MNDSMTRIDIFPLLIKLRKCFVISLGRVDDAYYVVVKIETRSSNL